NIGINIDCVMPRPKLWSASADRDGGYAMSLIRNRRDFLSALFSALLALALFDPGAATAQEVKQIKLTEKHIQGFMAASKDMARLYDGADPDKPDPKVEAQAGRCCQEERLCEPRPI